MNKVRKNDWLLFIFLFFHWTICSFVAFLVSRGVYLHMQGIATHRNRFLSWQQVTGPWVHRHLPRADSAHAPFQAAVSACHKRSSSTFVSKVLLLCAAYINLHNSQIFLLFPTPKVLPCFLSPQWHLELG